MLGVSKRAAQVTTRAPPDGVLEVVLDRAAERLSASVAQVYAADTEARALDLVLARGIQDEMQEEHSHVPFEAPAIVARAASSHRLEAVSSMHELDPALALTREVLSRMRLESVVATPLLDRDRLVGVLTFAWKDPHDLSPEERAAVDDCAEILSFGLAHQNEEEEARCFRVLFDALERASFAIADDFDVSTVLQDIVDAARQVTNAEYAALGIAVSEDRPLSPWVFSGMTEEQESAIGRHPRPLGTLGVVALEGRTVRVADVRRHPAFRGLPEHHPTMVSFLGVPICHEGRSLGNLYVANKRGAPEFSLNDERWVELLALHAAAAVHLSQLRAQLQAERARYSRAPYGIHTVEAETERILASRRAHEIAGQAVIPTVSEYRGQVCTPDGQPLPIDQFPSRRVLRGEKFETQELLLRTPDGREIPLFVSAVQVVRPDGRPEAVLVYEDISPLKELQRLRGEWASIVVHDLRQPLNVITTYVTMLQRMTDGADPAMLRRALERTRKSASALDRMIGDLADVSRIEAKSLPLERGPVDLERLAREVVERQRAVTPDRTIDLRASGPLPSVEADAGRIEQVLDNLLANALKYAEPGTAVQVEVRHVDGEVRARVTNRGPGISAEELPKVFDRYYRTARARAGGVIGLGLGLYIAKGLVEAHGGRIGVESQPGGTTTFEFALPI